MTRSEFMSTFTELVNHETYIFPGKEVMTEKLKDKERPIYVDESYYAVFDDLVQITEENLRMYAQWRDCHYYRLCRNPKTGAMAWLLTGGRYD